MLISGSQFKTGQVTQRPGKPEHTLNPVLRIACLAGFCLFGWSFFFLGAIFLFFFLELVADEFKDSDFGSIPDAKARRNDACVASGAIGKLRRDLAKKFLGDLRSHQISSGLTARLQRVALA